jgi:hypothetical protein
MLLVIIERFVTRTFISPDAWMQGAPVGPRKMPRDSELFTQGLDCRAICGPCQERFAYREYGM